MIARSETTAGILIGGRSSRMGRDKAFLPWGSGTLLQHTIDRLSGFSELLISAAPDMLLPDLPGRLIPDLRTAYGPLEGLYRLLRSAKTDWLFVCAVDLPLWEQSLLDLLLQAVDSGAAAVVPVCSEKPHPLFALYHRSALPVLEQLLCAAQHRMMALLDALPVRYVSIAEAGLSCDQLANANTPEEYERCRSLVQR